MKTTLLLLLLVPVVCFAQEKPTLQCQLQTGKADAYAQLLKEANDRIAELNGQIQVLMQKEKQAAPQESKGEK